MKNFSHALALIFGLASAVHPAAAMLTVNELMGFNVGGGGGGPPSVSFVGCTAVADTTSPFTYTAHATGTSGNRWTIVAVVAEDALTAFTINSMTVGGVSATEAIDNSADTGSVMQSAIYILSNPAGTTATIEFTTSEDLTETSICVWAAYDLTSETAYATAAEFQTASANIVLTLNVPTTGFGVGGCGITNTGPATTWTGMTERADADGAGHSYSAADTITVGTPLTVGCLFNGVSDAVGVSASFK